MPLSEHEQRLLEQMERALHAEDPRLASTLRNGSGRVVNGRRVFVGALAVIAGLAGLLGGVATAFAVLGVLGFLIMLGGVLLIGSAVRAPKGDAAQAVGEGQSADAEAKTASPKRVRNKQGSSFMDKIEARWRRRRDGEGF